jgi:hypothetical protein
MMKQLTAAALTVICLSSLAACATKNSKLIKSLEESRDHREWVRLSADIEKSGISVSSMSKLAYVKHMLVMMTYYDHSEQSRVESQLVGMGQEATPALVEGVKYAVLPAPIYSISGVANIPIFSMHILGQTKSIEAIPALIALVGKLGTDVPLAIMVEGEVIETDIATETLKQITSEDFRMDAKKWEAWYRQYISASNRDVQ